MMSDDFDSERTIPSVFDDEQCVDKKKEKRKLHEYSRTNNKNTNEADQRTIFLTTSS